MEMHRYPLLCWKVQPDHICGLVVGMDYQLVGAHVRKVQSALADRLTRIHQQGTEYLPPPLLSPRLHLVQVEFNPTYHEDDGLYPLPFSIRLQTPAVYGETEYGNSICYLPVLNKSFYFYHPHQLDMLARHFAQDTLSRLDPEEVHRYLLPGEPWLEEVVIKINESHNPRPTFRNHDNVDQMLQGLAERYPSRSTSKKQAGPVPEAAWERAAFVDQVVHRLWHEQVNLLLVGDSGVGKTAILREATRKVFKLSQGQESGHVRFWKTSPHRIMAGARYLGDWQKNCETLLQTLAASHDYLWFSDFVELVRAGGEGPEDSIAAFFTPAIRSGKLRIIGELTPQQLEAMRVALPGFIEFFQVLMVPEMDKPTVQKVLSHLQSYTQRNMDISLEQDALEQSYRWLARFERRESFPGKAMKFWGQCLNRAFLQQQQSIDRNAILPVFIENTGLPELFLHDDMKLDESDMQTFFSRRIIGQSEALDKIYQVIKVFKSGLNDPKKPIATLLFAGPTGVGKTACAQALADFFFGHGQKSNPLIRLDMSEFQHPIQIERLIGSGHGEPGKLIQQVREKPFAVVLLDEIEKAHSSIFDVLLTVLDEGILYDAFGRRTDFCNTIIIMTSNLGVDNTRRLGFSRSNDTNFASSIRAFFRPEFYNRLDAVVTFQSLSPESIHTIARKELDEIAQRDGLKKRKLQLTYTASLLDAIAHIGFHPQYGARPLQRAVERLVVSAIAHYLNQHPHTHNQQLQLDWQNDQTTVVSL